MKKVYAFTLLMAGLLFAFSTQVNAQDAGIFQTYVIYDLDGSGNAYNAGGINSDAATSYSGQSFGTPTSLVLNGGEIKSFKNSGGNVTGAELFYNIHPASSGPGTFISISLGFCSNIGGAPFAEDQKWTNVAAAECTGQGSGSGVDVLSGLAPGDYELEVFWVLHTSVGDKFDSDFGNNFSASFTVAAAAVPTLGQWGLIIFGLLLLCTGAVVVWRRQFRMKEVRA